jgi:hypothetical protein
MINMSKKEKKSEIEAHKLECINQCLNHGWEFVPNIKSDKWRFTGDTLVYREPVFLEDIVYNDKVFALPEELLKDFFVNDITVFLNGYDDYYYDVNGMYPRENTICYVEALGFHPHLGNSCGEFNHNFFCVGILDGKNFDRIPLIIEQSKHATYNNMMINSIASRAIEFLFTKLRSFDSIEKQKLEDRGLYKKLAVSSTKSMEIGTLFNGTNGY